MLAAHLAGAGLTGTWRCLTGEAGLFRLYERNIVDADVLTEGLGEVWHTMRLSMKPYPCCRCNHTLIEMALALHAEGLAPDDIAPGERAPQGLAVGQEIVEDGVDRGAGVAVLAQRERERDRAAV
ncbi:hypothetical protein DLJ53_33940 [Acuticoccus sediminis]|uniref:Uncharacterized protein n=1 Tax=Acuticoccus sediminis TaxID=2184697 RepID=A0A8B2NCE4_9HYPH|nr:hypothetical protein DLJ53_33940 [Acuticoccus sediminis]